jgi:SAM-dependent methyltransferase
MATGGLDHPADFARRFNPSEPLQEPLLLDVLERLALDEAAILDVGAGPATWLGKTHPRTRLRITAVDPLGGEYERLLAGAGLTPPVRTLALPGERVLDHFGPGSFDVAYARNALDHSADPVRIIRAMLGVVRPGGYVVLRHFENEGMTMRYEELHQWNFSAEDGRLIVSSGRRRTDVGRALGDAARIEAGVEGGSEHARWVTAVIQSRAVGT